MTSEPYWTERRLAIANWLHSKAPSLTELYRGAVEMMYGPRLPGYVTLTCHAVREIRNRLPDTVSPPESPNDEYLNYSKEFDKLVNLWDEFGPAEEVEHGDEQFDDSQSIQPFPPLPGGSVPIRREVYQVLAVLVRRHRGVGNKKLEAALRLFIASYPESRRNRSELLPIVEDWLSTTEWFMNRAHDSGSVDANCDRDELRAYFERFEGYLASFNQSDFTYFGAVEELRDIITDANAVEEPNT